MSSRRGAQVRPTSCAVRSRCREVRVEARADGAARFEPVLQLVFDLVDRRSCFLSPPSQARQLPNRQHILGAAPCWIYRWIPACRGSCRLLFAVAQLSQPTPVSFPNLLFFFLAPYFSTLLAAPTARILVERSGSRLPIYLHAHACGVFPCHRWMKDRFGFFPAMCILSPTAAGPHSPRAMATKKNNLCCAPLHSHQPTHSFSPFSDIRTNT